MGSEMCIRDSRSALAAMPVQAFVGEIHRLAIAIKKRPERILAECGEGFGPLVDIEQGARTHGVPVRRLRRAIFGTAVGSEE